MHHRCSTEVVHALLVACVTTAVLAASAGDRPLVPYPDGFRSWTVVKSLVIGPDHTSFATRGGMHHYYANEKAVRGYRSGRFPDGAIVVDEAVLTKDGEGPAKGILFEGERRALDVMVKDPRRYASTGGWGYEHFEKDDRDGRLSIRDRAACNACHATSPTDHVFSRFRP